MHVYWCLGCFEDSISFEQTIVDVPINISCKQYKSHQTCKLPKAEAPKPMKICNAWPNYTCPHHNILGKSKLEGHKVHQTLKIHTFFGKWNEGSLWLLHP